MYAIVKFVEEKDAPGIVCTHWINESEDMCRYPNVRTNEARDRLLQKLVEPANDWTSCRIRILRKYSTFSEAMLSLSRAEETSNLDTEEETEERRPRKKIKNSRYAEEDSEEDCGSPQRRKPTKKYYLEPYPKPLESSQVISATQASVPEEDEGQWEIPQQSISLARQRSPACSSSQSVINGKVIAWMADISEKVRQLQSGVDFAIKNLEKLLGRSHQAPATLQHYEDLELLGTLPVTDDSKFIELNKKISEDSRLLDLLIKVLVSVGGKDMRCHIHNMLRRLLCDEVAELYTLSGKSTVKNTVKKSFLGTEVSKSIICACQRVYKEATEVKIKEAVGDWLNQAKVRRSRRMERQGKLSVGLFDK